MRVSMRLVLWCRFLIQLFVWLMLVVPSVTAQNITNHKKLSILSKNPRLRKASHISIFDHSVQRRHHIHNASSTTASLPLSDEKFCQNGGSWDSAVQACVCLETFSGLKCELHVCLNGGSLTNGGKSCICTGDYEGDHCELLPCTEGKHRIEGKCACAGNHFGTFCELLCVHGTIVDGFCNCFEGFEGVTCTRCNASYLSQNRGSCADVARKRRPEMQSRFALSGLSLCLITIILLWISVVTRKRRALIAASHFERLAHDRLLREQQRRLHRAIAIQAPRSLRDASSCEFRQFVQAARNADLRMLANSSALFGLRYARPSDIGDPEALTREETPPPVYCATPMEAPPSYEEATRDEHRDSDPLK